MGFATDEELLPVVDGDDRPVGLARRADIHARGLSHRAAHVVLLDGAGRVYLQKRSQAKDTHPGLWTTSASGHVDPGESYFAAAQRELMEELGLALPLTALGKVATGPATENEFTFVYLAESDCKPLPNPEEIERGEFFTWDAAWRLVRDPERGCPCLAPVLRLVQRHLRLPVV